MILIRSIVFNILFYLNFIALMLVGSPCLLLSRRAAMGVVRLWARTSVGLLATICGIKVEFRNLHLLPKGASIIAVKHQSFLETFALILVLGNFSYVMKKELMSVPLFGWYVRGTGQIGVDRKKKGGALAQLVGAVKAKLMQGCQIVIFPEGTRRPVGVPPAYKTGISALCTAAGVACTPVALNTGLFWPRRSFVKRPGTVVIEFLPAIAPGLDKSDFMQALEAAIEPATNALVAAALAQDPELDRVLARRTALAICS